MYAVVKTGGKQYRIAKDDKILVDRLEPTEGDNIILSDILLFSDGKKITVGRPFVNNAHVKAEIIRQTRGPKILMLHRKRRKNHRRTQGHRQDLTLLKITDIVTDASKVKAEAQPAAKTQSVPKTKSASKATPAKKAKPASQAKSAAKPKTVAKAKSAPKSE